MEYFEREFFGAFRFRRVLLGDAELDFFFIIF